MYRLTDINRPITSAEFDPRKHIIYSTKQVKKEYKKRGMQLVSDAEKKRIARLVELDQRAQKIKDKEEKKKKNALKRKAKEEKDKEKGIINVPKKFKVTSSQCHLDGFFGNKRRKVKEEEDDEREEEDEDTGNEHGGPVRKEKESMNEDEEDIVDVAGGSEEDDSIGRTITHRKSVVSSDEEESEERVVLGEVDPNASTTISPKAGRKRRLPKTSKTPPQRKSPLLQKKPTVDSIPEESLGEEDDDARMLISASSRSRTSPLANRKRPRGRPPKAQPRNYHMPSQESTDGGSQSSQRIAQIRSFRRPQNEHERTDKRSPSKSPFFSGRALPPRRSLQSQKEPTASAMKKVDEDLPQAQDRLDDYGELDILDEPHNQQPSPPIGPSQAKSKVQELAPSQIRKPDIVEEIPSYEIPASDDEFSDLEIPEEMLEGVTTAQPPTPVISKEAEPPAKEERVIVDSEDEFDNDEDFLFEVSDSVLQNHNVPKEEKDTTVQEPQDLEAGEQQQHAAHSTQSIFSLSQYEPSVASSPPVQAEEDMLPPPLPPNPLPFTPHQQRRLDEPTEIAKIVDPPPEDDDLFSSSFPMTQCESIIIEAQALRTPAQTYHLPPRLNAITPAPVPATAPAPRKPETTAQTEAPPQFKDEFNVGSSFFDDDGLSDTDDDDRTITATASPRDHVALDTVAMFSASEEKSSHDYGSIDGLDETLLADFDQRGVETAKKLPIDAATEIHGQSASQASSSNYGDFTVEEASILDSMSL